MEVGKQRVPGLYEIAHGVSREHCLGSQSRRHEKAHSDINPAGTPSAIRADADRPPKVRHSGSLLLSTGRDEGVVVVGLPGRRCRA